MGTDVTLEQLQSRGFPMGAESLVALDLVDTLILVTDPPTDLIADPQQYSRWWKLQTGRLPTATIPSPAATQKLRAVIRSLFDAHLQGRKPAPVLIEDLNATAASVPTSLRLHGWGTSAKAEQRWHDHYEGSSALAAIATETISLLADHDRLDTLRRCANPGCSMLFLAENKRRIWCTANICGNRARAARHYQRTRARA